MLNHNATQAVDIDNLDWQNFEDLAVTLLQAMGLHAKITERSRDGGVDVIAHSTEPITGGTFVVQCKRYSSTVGVAKVRELYGVVAHTNASKGILITTSGFTRPAKQFAKGKPIELIDGNQLRALLLKHGLASAARIDKPPRPRGADHPAHRRVDDGKKHSPIRFISILVAILSIGGALGCLVALSVFLQTGISTGLPIPTPTPIPVLQMSPQEVKEVNKNATNDEWALLKKNMIGKRIIWSGRVADIHETYLEEYELTVEFPGTSIKVKTHAIDAHGVESLEEGDFITLEGEIDRISRSLFGLARLSVRVINIPTPTPTVVPPIVHLTPKEVEHIHTNGTDREWKRLKETMTGKRLKWQGRISSIREDNSLCIDFSGTDLTVYTEPLPEHTAQRLTRNETVTVEGRITRVWRLLGHVGVDVQVAHVAQRPPIGPSSMPSSIP